MPTVESSYEDLETAILHLTISDRSRLAARILESLEEDDSDISPKWLGEIERRAREIDQGVATLVPRETVWNRVNERFGTHFRE